MGPYCVDNYAMRLPAEVCEKLIGEWDEGNALHLNGGGARQCSLNILPKGHWSEGLVPCSLDVAEGSQLIRYREGDYFDWHDDAADERPIFTTVTIQLSAKDDYDGGTFEWEWRGRQFRADKGRGSILIIPSDVRHRVVPILSGERWALVHWFLAPWR